MSSSQSQSQPQQVSQSTSSLAPNSSCALVKLTGENVDMAWQWNSLRDINNRKSVPCDFCGKVTTGGITRAKRHQMGIRGDLKACKKIPAEIKKLLKDAFEKKEVEKDAYTVELQEDDDGEEEVQEILNIRNGKRIATSSIDTPTAILRAKKAKSVKGPMDLLIFRSPEATLKLAKPRSKQA